MGETPPNDAHPVQRLGAKLDHWAVRAVALALCALALSQVYYRGDTKQVTAVGDYYDLTYYYLNSKYFEELGYTRLYEAMLVADAQTEGRFKRIKRYRNLHHYRNVPVREAFDQADAIQSHFAPERWAAFQHDVDFLSRQRLAGGWAYFFKDHGYNPPPTWTFVGGILSSAVPIEHAKWITSIDAALVIGMLVLVAWVFGFWPFVLALLFFSLSLSGLWPKAGQALLRFDWLTCTVAAFCFARKKYFVLTGACLAYAASVRIFPAAFALPFFFAGVRDVIQLKTLAPAQRRVLAGAVAMVLLVGGGAFLRYGPGAFSDAATKIGLHAGTESYSSHRVGLGDAMVFHGEKTRAEINDNGAIRGKAEDIKQRSLYIRLLGLLFLIFIGRLVWFRYKGAPELVIPLCVGFVFILTTPQLNYFNMRLLLVLWAFADPHRFRSPFTIAWLTLIEVVGHLYVADVQRYWVTSTTSVLLTVYFTAILASYVYDAYWTGAQRPRWRWALLLVPVVLALPHAYYRVLENDAGAPQTIEASRLRSEKQAGAPWNGPGAATFSAAGLSLTFAAPQQATRIDVSMDGNDRYRFTFFRGDTAVGEMVDGPPAQVRRGLRRVTLDVPAAAQGGFDRVEVRGERGDGYFSIGHFIPHAAP